MDIFINSIRNLLHFQLTSELSTSFSLSFSSPSLRYHDQSDYTRENNNIYYFLAEVVFSWESRRVKRFFCMMTRENVKWMDLVRERKWRKGKVKGKRSENLFAYFHPLLLFTPLFYAFWLYYLLNFNFLRLRTAEANMENQLNNIFWCYDM